MPPDPISNTVVYSSKYDEANGTVSVEIVTGLLEERIYGIGGGDAGVCGLSESGVFEFDGERICSNTFDAIAVGGRHLVGIEPSGQLGESSLYSWGAGEFGELGLGPMTTFAIAPCRINYKGNFVQIDSSLNHSLAVDMHGNVFAWGQNFEKQLGLYTKNIADMKGVRDSSETEDVLFTPRFIPMSLGKPVLKVACGHSFSAVVTKCGEIWTWGAGESGQLGNGRCTFRELPREVSVAGGKKGEIGDMTPGDRVSSTIEKSRITFDDISCGAAHAVARSRDGFCYGWGMNKFGQLGVGDTDTRFTPTVVILEVVDENKQGTVGKIDRPKMMKVYAYSNCSAGIDANGLLYTWGSAHAGRLMRSGKTKSPTETASFNHHYLSEFTDGKKFKIRNYSLPDGGTLDRKRLVNPSEWGPASSVRDGNIGHADMTDAIFGGMVTSAKNINALRMTMKPGEETGNLVSNSSLGKGSENDSMPNFYALPEIVTACGDQTISSFTFARNQSAVLIETRIFALNPAMGPIKNFSRLTIFGEGFWDSRKIVIKFTSEDGEAPPRSTTGKLLSSRELICRPPKLQEAGMYSISVSMDGKNFLSQSLQVRIYKEMNVEKISPSLIDLRSPTTTNITMTLKNLKLYGEDEEDHNGDRMWPCESDLDGKFMVKLHVSTSPPGSQNPISTEVILPASLKPVPILEYDTVISGQNSIVSTRSGGEAMDERSAASEFKTDMDNKMEEGSTTSMSISVTNAYVDREVVCDVDFSSLGPAGSLVMIRGAVSINGQDYCSPSPESSPIICHSFSPDGCEPCCRPMYLPVHPDNNCNGNASAIAERSVSVVGSSFIPLDKLPVGLTIEAVIRTSVHTSGAGGKSKKEKSIEKVVPVTCFAANRLTFTVPTVDELLSPGPYIVSDLRNSVEGENVSRRSEDLHQREIPLEVFFQLVNTAAVTATTSRAGSKTKSSSPKKTSSPTKSSGKASRGKRNATQQSFLSENAIKILLYSSQPITVSPTILRRVGDSSSVFTLEGTRDGGFNFSSPNVRVVLCRDDLNLRFNLPKENVIMCPIELSEESETISSWLSTNSHHDKEEIDTTGYVATNIGQANKILIKHMPPLFMPEKAIMSESVELEETSEELASEEKADSVEEGVMGSDNAESEIRGEGGQNTMAESQHPIPLDFVYLKVLIDGESDVENEEHLTPLITYTYLEMSDEWIDVPKGGAVEGTSLHLKVTNGCVTSTHCVVRLRDSLGKFVDCTETAVSTEGDLATPASIAKYYSDHRQEIDTANIDNEVMGASSPNSDELADELVETIERDPTATSPDETPCDDAKDETSQEGKLDTGGYPGTITFECPDFSSLEPVVEGKDMLLFVDISLDNGGSFDKAQKPLLQVKM